MKFKYAEMRGLRAARARGATMADLCCVASFHSRNEVVEAIDALVRQPDTVLATEHVNRVLEMQAQGVPLINGWEAWEIEAPRISMRGQA